MSIIDDAGGRMDDKFRQVLLTLSKVLKDASNTLKSYVEYEKAIHDAFGEDTDPLAIDKIFVKILESAKKDPTLFGQVMIVLFELMKLLNENNNLNNLSSDKKIIIADKLLELSKNLEKFVGEDS